MAYELPADLRPFVEQELNTGRYDSEQHLVVEAIRRLQRERESATDGIISGLADVASARVQPLKETFADLRREFGIEGDS